MPGPAYLTTPLDLIGNGLPWSDRLLPCRLLFLPSTGTFPILLLGWQLLLGGKGQHPQSPRLLFVAFLGGSFAAEVVAAAPVLAVAAAAAMAAFSSLLLLPLPKALPHQHLRLERFWGGSFLCRTDGQDRGTLVLVSEETECPPFSLFSSGDVVGLASFSASSGPAPSRTSLTGLQDLDHVSDPGTT